MSYGATKDILFDAKSTFKVLVYECLTEEKLVSYAPYKNLEAD